MHTTELHMAIRGYNEENYVVQDQKRPESPGCSFSLIDLKIFFSGQSEAGNSNTSGTHGSVGTLVGPRIVNFHHDHSIVQTICIAAPGSLRRSFCITPYIFYADMQLLQFHTFSHKSK